MRCVRYMYIIEQNALRVLNISYLVEIFESKYRIFNRSMLFDSMDAQESACFKFGGNNILLPADTLLRTIEYSILIQFFESVL